MKNRIVIVCDILSPEAMHKMIDEILFEIDIAKNKDEANCCTINEDSTHYDFKMMKLSETSISAITGGENND